MQTSSRLADAALDQLFRTARTHNKFIDRDVDEDTLRRLHELAKWGPTSVNCQPARYVFVRSPEAKARLKPSLTPSNVQKTMAAPVTVIVAYDSRFFEQLPKQFPPNPGLMDMFANNPALAAETAVRNGTLQGAYLIMAARALGLDTGPISGFNAQVVDEEFFPDGRWKSNFLANLGWGDEAGLRPRGSRLSFEEVATIL